MANKKSKPLPWKQFSIGNSARLLIPFLWFEWICEQISYYLSRWAFIEVLGYIGKLSLLGAIVLFIWDIPKRRQADEDARKAKNYVAWQTLNSAIGKPGNAGRADALQDLNRDGVSLAGVDISGDVIFSKPLVLINADLSRAKISEAFFEKPNFSRAKMEGCRLDTVRFSFGNFSGADLSSASLTNVHFHGCDFSSAIISLDECKDVEFAYCDFHAAAIYLGTETRSFTDTKSSIHKASFTNTIFKFCNFTNCRLNIPPDQLTPDTLVTCNLFQVENGYTDVQSYATKNHMNASVPKVKFVDWLDWLDQNRQSLAGYNPAYEPFYKIDLERVKREWPSKK